MLINKGTLKDYFKSGNIPSETDYSNLIDSCFPVQGDGILIATNGINRTISLDMELIGKTIRNEIGEVDEVGNGEISIKQGDKIEKFSVNQTNSQTIDIIFPNGTINITDGENVRDTIKKGDDETNNINLSPLAFSGHWNDIVDAPEFTNPDLIQSDWKMNNEDDPSFIRNKPNYSDGILYITQNGVKVSAHDGKSQPPPANGKYYFTPATVTEVFYDIKATDWDAAEGEPNEILNKPILSRVAITGNYNDLYNSPGQSNNPTIKIYRNQVKNYDERFVGSGGGMDATATGTTKISVIDIDIIDGGSGYSSNNFPNVTIQDPLDPYGVTAIGEVTDVWNGAVVSVKITNKDANKGYSFQSRPSVTIDPPPSTSRDAVIEAILDTCLDEITITNAGDGYTSEPVIIIEGGNGAEAQAIIVWDEEDEEKENGRLYKIEITNRGYGFSDNVEITVEGGGGTGVVATGTLKTFVSDVNIVDGGNGYSRNDLPNITFEDPETGITATGEVTLVVNGSIFAVEITNKDTNRGYSFESPPIVTVDSPPASVGRRATAVAILDGCLDEITITNHGREYTSAPTITVVGGSGAVAYSTIIEDEEDENYGQLDEIIITEHGRGFYDNVEVIIGGVPIIFTLNQPNPQEFDLGLGLTAMTNNYNDLDNIPTCIVLDCDYNEFKETTINTLDDHENRIETLEIIGGRWCGRDFKTFEELNNFNTIENIPYINKDDYTHVIRDESEDARDINGNPQTSLYRWFGDEWRFGHVVQEDPIGEFTNNAFGVIKGDATKPGYISAQEDGTGKVNELPIVLDFDRDTKKMWVKGEIPNGYCVFGFDKGVVSEPMGLILNKHDEFSHEYSETSTNILDDTQWSKFYLYPYEND